MNYKRSEVFYCGVNEKNIKNAKPIINLENLSILKYWIKERYAIRLKKDVKKSQKPWTNDEILIKYRFCNVRREHDLESRWLIDNMVCSNLSYENKLLNIILFRLINKSETFKIFGLIDFFKFNFDEILIKYKKFSEKNQSYTYFSNAFFTSGQKVAANKKFLDKIPVILKIFLLVKSYFDEGLVEKIKNCKNQQEVFEVLRGLEGIGRFLAYQVFVDYTYLEEFPFSENEFVVAGPGCIRGLNLIFDDFDNLTYEEAIFWLRDNQKELFGENFGDLFEDLPELDRKLNVMCLENCMCEFSKYFRALRGMGRPKILYKSL